jgi:hypothetical protein
MKELCKIGYFDKKSNFPGRFLENDALFSNSVAKFNNANETIDSTGTFYDRVFHRGDPRDSNRH